MTDLKTWELPDEFWESLHEIRDFLIRDRDFTRQIFDPSNRRTRLRRAFDIMDNWLKKIDES